MVTDKVKTAEKIKVGKHVKVTKSTSNIRERSVNTEANTGGLKPPPRPEFRGDATKFAAEARRRSEVVSPMSRDV